MVIRHLRMDPQRLARRAGSFTFSLFLALSVPNSHASLSRGHPSKDVRVFSGSSEIHFAPEPSLGFDNRIPDTALDHPEPLTVGSESESEIESGEAVEATRITFAGAPTFGPKSLGKILPGDTPAPLPRGTGGYLPEVGSLSLRFAAPRRWPDPLPPPAEELAGPEIIFVFPPIVVREPATLENEPVAKDETDEESARETSTETRSAIADLITNEAKRSRAGITADMVVTSLNVLLHRGGDTPARFEPAIIADPVAEVLSGSIQ